MAMNAGFAAYLARKGGVVKKVVGKKKVDKLTPGDTTDKAVLPGQMVAAIKSSPKGKIPAGLAKYMKSKKK